jgi:hypothetical protein
VKIVPFLSKPAPAPWLWGIIVTGNLYGLMVYGATFWVDSGVYIYFSPIFESLQKAKEVFNSSTVAIFSHFGEGIPFFWFLLSKLPEAWIWPVMALTQHALAATAMIYLFSTLNRLYPTPLHLVTCGILSFLPIYQSMHNALLTESISSSCAMLALAATLNLNDPGRSHKGSLAVLLVSTFVAVQVRSYFLIFPAGYLVALLIKQRLSIGKIMLSGLICAAALLVAPSHRFFVTGTLQLPYNGFAFIHNAHEASRYTPESVLRYAATLSWPDSTFLAKLATTGLTNADLLKLSLFWRDQGLSDDQMVAIYKTLVRHYRESEGNFTRSLMATAVCLGFPSPMLVMPDMYGPQRGKSGRQSFEHFIEHYRYLSWINPSKEIYERLTTPYYFGDLAGHQLFLRAWAPYVRFPKTFWLNDPFWLGSVFPDIWFIIGVLSISYLVFRRNFVATFFILPLLAMIIITYKLQMAGIRYCFIFVIMDIIAASIAAGCAFQPAVHGKAIRDG